MSKDYQKKKTWYNEHRLQKVAQKFLPVYVIPCVMLPIHMVNL